MHGLPDLTPAFLIAVFLAGYLSLRLVEWLVKVIARHVSISWKK